MPSSASKNNPYRIYTDIYTLALAHPHFPLIMRFHAALLALVASAIFLAAGIVDASSPAAPIPSIEGDATMSSATMMTTKAGQTTSGA